METTFTRRAVLKTLAGASLAASTSGLTSGIRAASTDHNGKQNYLFLVVDDLRQTTGAWGDPVAISPHLDRFLEGATVFKNAFCTFPVCGPSRNAILSGIRPSKSGLIENGPESLRVGHPWVVTIPELMKNNGYETFGMGKIFHHDQDVSGMDAVLPVSTFNQGVSEPACRGRLGRICRVHRSSCARLSGWVRHT